MRKLFNWIYRLFLRADIRALEIHRADLTNAMRCALDERAYMSLYVARAETEKQLAVSCALYKNVCGERKTLGAA